MSVLKDLAKIVGAVIAIVAVVALALIATVSIGYLVGMFIAITPFVSDWLTEGTGLSKTDIPTITAWIAVVGIFIGGSSKAGEGGKNG